jgi:hypothetical protein
MGQLFGAHALSLVTFAPPIFLILRRRWLDTSKFSRQRLLEWLGLLGAVALATLITFGQSKVPLVIVPLVPMVAATFRLGRLGAVASLLILICGGMGGTMAGYGPTVLLPVDMATKLLVLQIYFACVVLILLPVAAELRRGGGCCRPCAMQRRCTGWWWNAPATSSCGSMTAHCALFPIPPFGFGVINRMKSLAARSMICCIR